MKNIAYYNGRTCAIEDMMVPMQDRACYFGDGVYDVTYVYNHIPMALDDHISRIYRSASMIDISVEMPREEMKALLGDLIRQVDGDSLIMYWQISRGTGPRKHDYSNLSGGANLWAYIKPATPIDPFGSYRGVTLEDLRFLYCNIKTINLLPSVLANHRAAAAGAEEAILHRGGRVTEGSHSNIHIIRDGVLRTAPLDRQILPGITRAHILKICGRLGIPVKEEAFTLDEMMGADEVFFSASGALCCRFYEIDGRPVGGRDPETFAAIRDAYEAERRKECGLE